VSAVSPFLDDGERATVEESLALLRDRSPAQAAQCEAALERLSRSAALVGDFPSIVEKSSDTLIDLLCRVPEYDLDMHIPTKAVLGNAYLLVKINFFKGLGYALEGIAAPADLMERVQNEAGQSIYTKLAEELFLAIVTDPNERRNVKVHAARELFHIWEHRLDAEIDDFAPLLESAWHARNRINSAYGTLLGATETFRLVTEDCSPEVLEFFGRDGMTADESAAFEEFLFNMTSEELATLRRAMQQQHVSAASPAWAADVLGRQIEDLEHSHEIDPMALYRSYNRRQLAADFRMMSGAPGPRRTAEGYLMVYLLDQQ